MIFVTNKVIVSYIMVYLNTAIRRLSCYLQNAVAALLSLSVFSCAKDNGGNMDLPIPRPVPGAAYYIDSNAGDDENAGMSADEAWASFANVKKGLLTPGDTLYLLRGSEFDKMLLIEDSGKEDAPIVVTSYGDSSLPLPSFTNTVFNPDNGDYGNCVRLKGSHIILENIYCHGTVAELPEDAGGFLTIWELGAIFIDKTASYCIVRDNEIYDCGVGIKSYGRNALIDNNYVHDCNRVLKKWSWGPIAIWLGEDYQEVRNNTIVNYSAVDPNINWGPGSYGGGADGGAIEIDDARVAKSNINIHHNYTKDNQGFIEVTWTDVGQNPDYRNFHVHHNVCDDYQQFVALWCGRECLFENNTIIRRKKNANDWGIFNISTDNTGNIIRNNIIVTEKDIPIFLVGSKNNRHPASEISNNIYWAADKEDGTPEFGYEGPGEDYTVADPVFVNYAGNSMEDFMLRDDSPYKNSGIGAF